MAKMLDENEEWEEIFAADNNSINEIENSDLKEYLLGKMTEALTEREKNILCDLFFNFGAATYEFVGRRHGVTRERIRQISAKALIKLRRKIKREWKEENRNCEARLKRKEEREKRELNKKIQQVETEIAAKLLLFLKLRLMRAFILG